MTDLWDERKKALENQYFYKEEQEKIEKLRQETREQLIRSHCRNRCPKCGDEIQPMTFRDVPLDKCPGCGGIWLGPKDLKTLAEKDHRTWFDSGSAWRRNERGRRKFLNIHTGRFRRPVLFGRRRGRGSRGVGRVRCGW